MRGLVGVMVAGLVACGGSPRTIKIPDSVVQNPKSADAKRDGAIQPYVIKMSDGQRTWQIEIPAAQTTGAFQAVVPLDLGEASAAGAASKPDNQADREIKRGRAPDAASAKPEGSPETSQSYLSTLAKVNALFRKKQYELALIEIVKLEQSYPDDERVLEMKGTLYWRLKKPKLAREAWERVLAINPDNTIVAQALENLLGD